MLEDLYASSMDIAAYLRRIGMDPQRYDRRLHPELPPSPTDYSMPQTKESLDLLINAHLHHVPFENLDIYDLRKEVSLALPALFQKIVVQKRGGYCFELNALFFALLEGLGFRAYPIAQRVLLGEDFAPLNHRAAVVTLESTRERLLCDVGFGGPMPVTALRLECGAVQKSGKLRFRLDTEFRRGLRRLILVGKKKEIPLMLFSAAPVDPVDFIPLTTYMTCHKKSIFYCNRILNLLREGGSVSVVNDRLRIHHDGRLEERPIASRAELKRICVDYFGIPEESLTEF